MGVGSEPEAIKLDFHLHTLDDPRDHHVYHTVFELIDKAAALGYGALAITLHTRQFVSSKAEDYASRRGILLIPGVEQDIEGCHVLLINFRPEVANSIHTFEELAKHRSEDTLVIAAHPFYPQDICLKDKLEENAAMFDAVELSGYYHRLWNPNLKAESTAERLGKPVVANSDTHTLEQFGSTWSEVFCEKNAKSIVHSIKAGRVTPKSRPLSLSVLLLVGWKVVVLGYCKWINYKRQRGYQPPT